MITFAERIGIREPTMTEALRLLEARGGRTIVETGCARLAENWGGDGLSTLVFGAWVKDHHGTLTTVDANPDNLETCRALTEEWSDRITYVHDDSVHFLQGHETPIDLLYLDSFDYPLHTLVELYGSMDDFTNTVEHLKALGDDFLIDNHIEVIWDCQRHAASEVRAAFKNLHRQSIVLIDDANLPGGGKARLARQVLSWNGWVCVMDEYQTLWVRS